MSLSSTNNNHSSPSDLISLLKIGFKLVPLSENHIPFGEWSPIYDNPDYWSIEKLSESDTFSKFINVASTSGKTHIKDSNNKELFLQVLDVDSEPVCKILNTSISQLGISSLFNSQETSEDEYSNLTLLDLCKRHTFVTKTKKEYGFHIWWLSHSQNKSISSSDCKKGNEFEIKTDKKMCTLPPSTHREDKEFRYLAVGRQDELWINDELYDVFYRLFREFLIRGIGNKNNEAKENLSPKQITFYNLSSETIEKSINILSRYYKEGNRNDIALSFSGMAFHCRVSEQSATAILEGICDIKKDLEKQSRLYTLRSTYKNGIGGKPITGVSALAELVEKVSGGSATTISDAYSDVRKLKNMWRDEIPKELSIVQAKRKKSGFVNVKGTIIGISSVYNLIKSICWNCSSCEWSTMEQFKIPKFKVNNKGKDKCPSCKKDDEFINTVYPTLEYVSVIDLELQDIDGQNEIERLPVRVFEKDTYNIAAGEVVNIVGHLHVIRKNDSIRNKLETFLFADSIEYAKRKELILTDKDIEQINEWKDSQLKQGKNPIDSLVELFAPELIDLDTVKKGLLIVCVNAGFKNQENNFPKRLRLNALLIGDPGLAKTTILDRITKLVPNSQYAGGQSSTGLSLTAQISKEDGGGMYSLRFGPVVLAKDSICAINELGQLPIEDHKHLLDCMEENGFPIAKFGISMYIEAHPSIIASSNPINNKWQNSETISTREIPTLHQVIQRFDLIFVFRENTNPSYLARYVDKRKKIAEDYKKGIYDGNEDFIRKYLLYARSLKPELTEEAHALLKCFLIDMGINGVSGLPRKLDSLNRLTISIAKLKLKDVAEVEDAQEAMMIYNDTLKAFNQAVLLAANPRDIAYEQIRNVVKENNGSLISLTNAAMKAAQQNKDVKYYLKIKEEVEGDDTKTTGIKLNENWHLREILNLFRKDESIQVVQEKPTILRWKGENNSTYTKDQVKEPIVVSKEDNIEQHQMDKDGQQFYQCDECDECEGIQKKNILQTNLDSYGISLFALKDEQDNRPIKTNNCNNSLFDNQINTIESTTTIEEEQNNGIDRNEIKLQKNEQSEPSSHSSHSSHSTIVVEENGGLSVEDTKTKSDNATNPQQIIQLNHSPFADIYTDKINLELEQDHSSDVKLSK